MSTLLMRPFSRRLTALIAAECALITGAIVVTTYSRLGPLAWEPAEHVFAKTLLIVLICQMCLYYGDLYDLHVVASHRELVVRLLTSLGAASMILAALYFLFPDLIIGRGIFLIAATLAIGLIIGWRTVFHWASRRLGPRERLLIVGTNAAAVGLARELYDRRDLGVEIVGFVEADRSRIGEPVINPKVIGTIDDIPDIVRRASVGRVVVSLADARGRLPMDRLLEIRLSDGVPFDHLASVYEEYTGKIAVEDLRPSWFIFSSGFRKTRRLTAAKRLLDVVVASVALVIALPVMALIALAVKATSRGPALYHQKRVGKHGRIFIVHKFRSMGCDAEAQTGAVWATRNDVRVTPIGGVLRRTRLDELPQLWNVVRGDMSLVGPRPERPEFVRQLTDRIPFYGQRHVVQPGLTGWAQVRYTYGASVEDALEKLQYDLFYIKNMSIALDLYIIFETVKTVILRRGAC